MTDDNKLLPQFESIKDSNEELLWIGKPKLIPYICTRILSGILTFGFAIVWLLAAKNIHSDADSSLSPYFWVFGLIPSFVLVFTFLKKLFSFPNTAYSYSDRRVIIRSGFIGTDFKTIDYDKISDMQVTVSVIERLYDVGTIRFFSGRTQTNKGSTIKLYDSWSAIENPYDVFRMVKQTALKIKTDFNYPNALRPDSNPGFKTKYQS